MSAGVGVFAGESIGGGEKDPGAVCGHPVIEDSVTGSGRQVDRLGGIADVHVEVPVAVAGGIGGDQLADEDALPVGGDVELGEPPSRAAVRLTQAMLPPAGSLETAWVWLVARSRS